MRLKGKVAIITGGASGIGRESCMVFAREGAKVVIADISADKGNEVAAEIASQGGEAILVPTDVTKEDQVVRLINEAVRHFGKIDVLFNNTTWYTTVPAVEMPLEDWQRTIDTTLTGPFLCSKYAIAEMMKSGGGSIISTSSVGGTVAFEAHPAYNAAKGGLNLLMKNLALDYGKHQIRANCISPGIIETPLTANNLSQPEKREQLLNRCFTRRIGRPDDIAYAAVFLASDEATFITGTNFHVDNGWTAR
jgi:NAD(P)-dependent dehydrogenase (short-subunit alcohol dehydrogenase family)